MATARGTLIDVSNSIPGPPRWIRSIPVPRSPLARAVLPVLGGIVVILLLFGATWAIASRIARGDVESSERLAPTIFEVGRLESIAATIADTGPILLPGLNTTSGERTVVVNHEGDDPAHGWHAYWAYPADGDSSCGVTQVRHTDRFTDCRGRELSVMDLALPKGVCPLVEQSEKLYLNLRCPV